MATTDRMRIEIVADNKSANQAFSQTNTQLDAMSQHAVRVAQSISQHFQAMAREIQQAIQGLGGAFNGLDSQTKRLVDQFGRPVGGNTGGNGNIPYMPVVGPSDNASPFAGTMAAIARAQRNPKILNDFIKSMSEAADEAASRIFSDYSKNVDAAVRSAFSGNEAAVFAGRSGFGAMLAGYEKPATPEMKQAVENLKQSLPRQELAAFHTEVTQNAQGLRDLAIATNDTGESMGRSVGKAVLWYQALEGGIHIVKELTIESAKTAAHARSYESAMYAVARANGVSATSAENAEKALKKMGITTMSARQGLIQAIAAGIPLDALLGVEGQSKANPRMTGLARMSQNLAVAHPETTSSEMFIRLMHGIVSGETEVLRSAGINVNFERAYAQRAKELRISNPADLPEYERMLARVNAVLKESVRYAGQYDAAQEEVGKQMQSLQRFADEASRAIGEGLLPALGGIVAIATKMAQTVADNPWLARIVAIGGTTLAGAGAGAAIGSVIPGVGTATVAGIGAGVGLVAGAGSVIYDVATEDSRKAAADAKKKADDAKAKQTAAELKAQRETEARQQKQMREDEADRQLLRQSRRAAADALYSAAGKGLEGRFAIEADYRKRLQELHTRVDAGGNVRVLRTDPATARLLSQAKNLEIQNEVKKMGLDLDKQIDAERTNQLEGEARHGELLKAEIKNLQRLGYDTDALKQKTEALNDAKRQTAIVEEQRRTRDDLRQAQLEEVQGYRRITAELELQLLIMKEQGKWSQEAEDNLRNIAKLRSGTLDRQNRDEYDRLAGENRKNALNAQADTLEMQKAAELASLESVYTWDLKTKLDVETQKYQIESRYLDLIAEKKRQLREEQYNEDLVELNKRLWRDEITQQQYQERLKLLRDNYRVDDQKLTEQTTQAQTQLWKTTVHQMRLEVQQEYRNLYDRIKQSADGVLDAMLTKSENIFQAIGNMFKSLFLTILKEIASSQIAKTITQLLTGTSVQMRPAAGTALGGPAGSIGSILGALGVGGVPVFGNTGGQPIYNRMYAPGRTYAQQVSGGPGGTSGFTGPVGLMMGGAAAAMHAEAAVPAILPNGGYIPGAYDAMGMPVRSSVFNPVMLPNIGGKGFQLQGGFGGKWGSAANGLMTMVSLSMALQGLTQRGIGGTINRAGGAGMAAWGLAGKQLGMVGSIGTGLAYDGIVRGGWAGMGEAAAGGAMIGAQFGGPIGAVIGGVAGFAAAGLRTLFGGERPEDKLRKRIKSLTGVDVKQRSTLTDWLKQIGGTTTPMMDLWIRSRAGQEAIELYAQNAGQPFKSKFNSPQFALIGAGGSLFEATPYLNGQAMASQSVFPTTGLSLQSGLTLDQIQAGTASAPINLTVQLDGAATKEFHETNTLKVIANNPRKVQAAANKATSSSFGRAAQQINTMNPLAIRS